MLKKEKHKRNKNIVWQIITPQRPIYVASYVEENAPTLVNNLIPKPIPKEKKDAKKMEESKTAEDKRNRIEIKDEEDELESDRDSDYSY